MLYKCTNAYQTKVLIAFVDLSLRSIQSPWCWFESWRHTHKTSLKNSHSVDVTSWCHKNKNWFTVRYLYKVTSWRHKYQKLVHCTLSLQSYTTGNFGLPRVTTYAVQPLHEQLGRRQKNPYAGETVQSFNVSSSPRGRPRNVIDQYADGERL